MEGMQRSEDCLRLSVHVPAGECVDLPTMIWIHGGAYMNGAGDAKSYDPTEFVRQERVVVVNVTYRLGLLGYLGTDNGPANLGLLDQIEALKWVNRNITAFGGSNTNVTVFGHSAGADAAAHLMIAKGAEGLFHRAIIQSAPFGVLKDRQKMQTAMKEACRGLTRETPIDEVITRTQVVLEKSRGFGNGSYMPFGIQYGVHPLPNESEVNAAFIKVAPKFEILLGMTEREVAIFGLLFPMLYNALKYPILSSISEKVIVKPLTKKIYGGVRDFARQHAKAGGKTYQYLFTSTSTDKHVNAGHSAEIPLLFGSKDYYKESRLVAGISWSLLVEQGKQVKRIWADFARNGSISTYKIPDCLVIEEVKS